MKKDALSFNLLLFFQIFSIIIVTGRFIDIAGVGAIILWFVPPILTFYYIIKISNKQTIKLVVLLLILTAYMITSGLRLLRKSMESVFSEEKIGNKYTVIYEVSPGPMSHTSYDINQYIILDDNIFIRIMILESSEHTRYIG